MPNRSPGPVRGRPLTARARMRQAGVVLVVAVLIGAAALSPASADDLTDRREELLQQIGQTQQQMNESSQQAAAAAVALTTAQARLRSSQAGWERTQRAVAAAQKKDAALATKLRSRRIALARAAAAVAAGQRHLADQKERVGQIVRNQFQQRSNLVPLAILTTDTSANQLHERIQLSRTMLDANQATFSRLATLQQQLTADRERQAELETQVTAAKAASGDNLRTKRKLQTQAATQRAEVGQLVRRRQAAQKAASVAAAADKTRYAELQRENAEVQQRIGQRIARQKAAARRAAAAKADEPESSKGSTDSSVTSASGFSDPVQAPITSPYGMRLHPILRVWKLHDGTDFGAGCGTAIRAPYAGRVAERYFNTGYGNRLIIDHGRVDGRYLSTAMNHAARYTVSPGDRVRQGQVIGYVGTTGYSTGCHLHLMMWSNGTMINPMTRY